MGHKKYQSLFNYANRLFGRTSSEIINLQRQDIDLQKPHQSEESKREKYRIAILSQKVKDGPHNLSQEKSRRVFQTNRCGKYTQRTIQKIMENATNPKTFFCSQPAGKWRRYCVNKRFARKSGYQYNSNLYKGFKQRPLKNKKSTRSIFLFLRYVPVWAFAFWADSWIFFYFYSWYPFVFASFTSKSRNFNDYLSHASEKTAHPHKISRKSYTSMRNKRQDLYIRRPFLSYACISR